MPKNVTGSKPKRKVAKYGKLAIAGFLSKYTDYLRTERGVILTDKPALIKQFVATHVK